MSATLINIISDQSVNNNQLSKKSSSELSGQLSWASTIEIDSDQQIYSETDFSDQLVKVQLESNLNTLNSGKDIPLMNSLVEDKIDLLNSDNSDAVLFTESMDSEDKSLNSVKNLDTNHSELLTNKTTIKLEGEKLGLIRTALDSDSLNIHQQANKSSNLVNGANHKNQDLHSIITGTKTKKSAVLMQNIIQENIKEKVLIDSTKFKSVDTKSVDTKTIDSKPIDNKLVDAKLSDANSKLFSEKKTADLFVNHSKSAVNRLSNNSLSSPVSPLESQVELPVDKINEALLLNKKSTIQTDKKVIENGVIEGRAFETTMKIKGSNEVHSSILKNVSQLPHGEMLSKNIDMQQQQLINNESVLSSSPSLLSANPLMPTAELNLTSQIAANSLIQSGLSLRKDFTPNLALRIQWVYKQALSSAEILMDPPELGPLTVKMTHKNGETNIIFHVSNPMTKETVEDNLPKLKELLAEQGITLGDTQVEQNQKEENNESLTKNTKSNGSTEFEDEELIVNEEISTALLDTYI